MLSVREYSSNAASFDCIINFNSRSGCSSRKDGDDRYRNVLSAQMHSKVTGFYHARSPTRPNAAHIAFITVFVMRSSLDTHTKVRTAYASYTTLNAVLTNAPEGCDEKSRNASPNVFTAADTDTGPE